MEYLRSSREITGISFKEEDYFEDLQKAVCLLLSDGLEFTFAHRSFQEYFSAIYIAKSADDLQKELAEKIGIQFARVNAAQLYSLLFDIDRGGFERNFSIPALEYIEKNTKDNDLEESILKYAELVLDEAFFSSMREARYGYVVRNTAWFLPIIRAVARHKDDIYKVKISGEKKRKMQFQMQHSQETNNILN